MYSPLPQQEMIVRVQALCRQDPAVRAALMYGSFALGEADEHSDIEFVLFIADEALACLDRRAWLEQVAPTELVFVNEFGITAVIFHNLVRGEFHFDPLSRLEEIAAAWRGVVWFPSLEAALVVDKDARLTPWLEPLIGEPLTHGRSLEEAQMVLNRLLNAFVFGGSVLARGEWARALEMLGVVQRSLLMMARIAYGTTVHWHIPSRSLEDDLPAVAYERYRACTAPLDPAALQNAYRAVWAWANELLPLVRERVALQVPERLMASISAWVARIGDRDY